MNFFNTAVIAALVISGAVAPTTTEVAATSASTVIVSVSGSIGTLAL